jgi:hypothetical protein
MSKPPKSPAPLSVERILQIGNDIAEDIDNGHSKEELRAVCRYWMNEASRVNSLRLIQLQQVAGLALEKVTENVLQRRGAKVLTQSRKDAKTAKKL